MMQVAFGVTTFTKGIKNYLLTRQFDSATPDDLYNGLRQALNEDSGSTDLDVTTILKSWETQAGYPVISVTRNATRMTLTQERFFYTNQSSSNLWWVPINYATASNPHFTETKPDFWMEGEKSFSLTNTTAPKSWKNTDWIVVNIQESGYYRVNYDSNLWNLLIKQLNNTDYNQIHLLNRAQLIDDSLNLARAGKISYNIPFEIIEYLIKEYDYIPWASVSESF